MARVPESDMVMLTLSLIGGLAVAPYVFRPPVRGAANKLGPTQKRLLYLPKMLPNDPEAVIRTTDLVISALVGRGTLPGVGAPRDVLEQDIRESEVTGSPGWRPGMTAGRPEATLHDYVALTSAMIKDNVHFGQDDVVFGRSRYDKVIPWLGMVVRTLLEQARRSELDVRPGARDRVYWPGRGEPSDQEVETLRRLGLMGRHLPAVADWVMATRPVLTGGRDAAGRKVKPLTWNQARHRSSRWHSKMQAQTPANITPGVVVYRGADGWTVQRLERRVCLLEEGRSLGHCVKGEDYWQSVSRGASEIYSLRLPNGTPVVTFEVVYAGRIGDSFRFAQAKGKRNRLLGMKKAQTVTECLHARAWMEQLLGRPVRPADITRDFVSCQQILLRITGWDRIDTVRAGEAPDPMPTQSEYKKAMKQLAVPRRQAGTANRSGRRSMGSLSMQRPPPIYSVKRARKAKRLIEQILSRVARAARADNEVPVEQRKRMAEVTHRAVLILDGYLVGRPPTDSVSRAMRKATEKALVDYDTTDPVYLSDDGYSRLVLNLVRLDDSEPWLYVASQSLDDTKTRWVALTGRES